MKFSFTPDRFSNGWQHNLMVEDPTATCVVCEKSLQIETTPNFAVLFILTPEEERASIVLPEIQLWFTSAPCMYYSGIMCDNYIYLVCSPVCKALYSLTGMIYA